MATQYVPLTPALIDEGLFIEDMNQELASLQSGLVQFLKQYGEKAEKAVAKLTIEIALKVENVNDEGAYSIKTTMKATLPKRPASVSIAMGGVDDHDRMALFVRKTGSDSDTPKQAKLATRDGRTIDTKSGDVLE